MRILNIKSINIVLAVIVYFLAASAQGREKMYEKDYVKMYCKGEIEYVLPDKTRVDCLTDEYAIEFDYAKKWAESIGQSLYYSRMTNRKPAVAIIIKSPSDEKYIERIHKALPNLRVFTINSCDEN